MVVFNDYFFLKKNILCGFYDYFYYIMHIWSLFIAYFMVKQRIDSIQMESDLNNKSECAFYDIKSCEWKQFANQFASKRKGSDEVWLMRFCGW